MKSPHHLPKCVVSFLFVSLVSLTACTPEQRQYGEGGAGGATSNSSSSSSSSGTTLCTIDAECGANSECQSFQCVNGSCDVLFAPMGTAVAMQAIGDCQSNVCDGKGYVIKVPDAADPNHDGNPCTVDACAGTETQYGNLPTGMSCNGTQICDGNGSCVDCLNDADCNGNAVCYNNTCVTAQCSNSMRDGLETDTDCGGSQCPRCSDGFACNVDLDCKSLVCGGGKCAAPTCTDNVLNGAETDVDCGGGNCPLCPTGKKCKAGFDCASFVCVGGACKAPSCTDQVQNGNESDVDCGGTCSKCANGRSCNESKDCTSNYCCPGDINTPGYCEKAGLPCAIPLRSDMTQ